MKHLPPLYPHAPHSNLVTVFLFFSYPVGSAALKAALVIQNWYRGYSARLKARQRYALTIFQSIEYADEQGQLQVCFESSSLLLLLFCFFFLVRVCEGLVS